MAWDFATIVQEFATPGGVSITRRAAGTNDAGMFRPGASSTVTMSPAVIHPASGRDMERLPEGQRTKETITVLTVEALRVGTPGGVMADRVSYGGETYEVVHSDDWAAQAGYYRALAVKIEPEPALPA